MSSLARGAPGAVRPKSLNVNTIYSGRNLAAGARAGGKNGLQSVGKSSGVVRRMPPPATLPSLKAENNGQDPTIAVVPQGGGGWSKGDASPPPDVEKKSTSATNASANDMRPSWLQQNASESQPSNASATSAREFPSLATVGANTAVVKPINKWETNELSQKLRESSSEETVSHEIPTRFFDNTAHTSRHPPRQYVSNDARLSQSEYMRQSWSDNSVADENILFSSRVHTNGHQKESARAHKPVEKPVASPKDVIEYSDPSVKKKTAKEMRILKRTEQLLLQDISDDDEEIQMTRLNKPAVSIIKRNVSHEGDTNDFPATKTSAKEGSSRKENAVKPKPRENKSSGKKRANKASLVDVEKVEARSLEVVEEKECEKTPEEVLPAPLPAENIWAKRQEERESQERDRVIASRMPKAMQQAIEQHFPLVTESATIKVDKESTRKTSDADFARAALRARKQATSNDVRRLMTKEELGAQSERLASMQQRERFYKRNGPNLGDSQEDPDRVRGPKVGVNTKKGKITQEVMPQQRIRVQRRPTDENVADEEERDVGKRSSYAQLKRSFDKQGFVNGKDDYEQNTKIIEPTMNMEEQDEQVLENEGVRMANRVRARNLRIAGRVPYSEKFKMSKKGEKQENGHKNISKVNGQVFNVNNNEKSVEGDDEYRGESPPEDGEFEEVINKRTKKQKEKDATKKPVNRPEGTRAVRNQKKPRKVDEQRPGKEVEEVARVDRKHGTQKEARTSSDAKKAHLYDQLESQHVDISSRELSVESNEIRPSDEPQVIKHIAEPVKTRKEMLELPESVHTHSAPSADRYDFVFDPHLHVVNPIAERQSAPPLNATAEDFHLKEKMKNIKDFWAAEGERGNLALVKPQAKGGDAEREALLAANGLPTRGSNSHSLAPYHAHYSSFQPLYNDVRSRIFAPTNNATSPPSTNPLNVFGGFASQPANSALGLSNFDVGLNLQTRGSVGGSNNWSNPDGASFSQTPPPILQNSSFGFLNANTASQSQNDVRKYMGNASNFGLTSGQTAFIEGRSGLANLAVGSQRRNGVFGAPCPATNAPPPPPQPSQLHNGNIMSLFAQPPPPMRYNGQNRPSNNSDSANPFFFNEFGGNNGRQLCSGPANSSQTSNQNWGDAQSFYNHLAAQQQQRQTFQTGLQSGNRNVRRQFVGQNGRQ